MAMNIMWKRYRNALTPAEFMANTFYEYADTYAYQKNPENFSGDEHLEKFIVPITWNDEIKIHGLVAPLNFPICEGSNLSFKEVKDIFLDKWKSTDCGKYFRHNFQIVHEDIKKSKSKEIQSYINWKNSEHKERLAFIYLGIFWMYKDETETLSQAAHRFFEENADNTLLQKSLNREFEKKYWKDDSNRYAKAILNDGALLFDQHTKKAFSRIHYYGDPSATMWKGLCVLGYFPWVSRLDFFTDWDYDDYIE